MSGRRRLVASAALVAALAADPGGSAEALDLVPRLTSLSGQLEVGGLYESLATDAGDEKLSTSDRFLTERVSLAATGWVYHPRLVIFLARVGGGLAEEDVSSDLAARDSGGMHTATLDEHELRAVFLPEHPYNLELFTVRRNPYTPGRLALGSESAGTDTGAVLRYKDRPYAATLSYRESTQSSSTFDKSTDALTSSAAWFKDWGSLAGSYAHTVTDGSFEGFASHAVSSDYSAENQLRFFGSRLTLGSAVSRVDYAQSTVEERLDDRRWSWSERLGLELPWRLTATVSYDRGSETSGRAGAAGAAAEETNATQGYGVSLLHRLYESLTSNYDLAVLSLDSDTGDSRSVTHALSENYTKRIPGGLLLASVSGGLGKLDRSGNPGVVNEPHESALFGEFTLGHTGVDPASVRLAVRSATTGELVDLARDVHFRLAAVGETLRVAIVALPASAQSPDPFHVYSFLATYALAEGATTVDTTTVGGTLRLELFGRLVNPYGAWTRASQDESGGPRSGATIETTDTTLGVQLVRGAWSLTLEREDFGSDLSPYLRTKAELDLNAPLADDGQVLGQAVATRTRHGRGTLQEQELTEDFVGASLRYQRRLPRRNLTLLVGGTWNRSTGLADRSAESVEAEVVWTIRQLEITGSVSVGRSSADYAGGTQQSLHQSYYLKVVRRLF